MNMFYFYLILVLILFSILFFLWRGLYQRVLIEQKRAQAQFSVLLPYHQKWTQSPGMPGALAGLAAAQTCQIAGLPLQARQFALASLERGLPPAYQGKAFIHLAQASMLLGEAGRAHKEALRALRLCELSRERQDVAAALLVVARMEAIYGNFERAEKCLDKVWQIDSWNVEVEGQQAWQSLWAGQWDQAIERFRSHLQRMDRIRTAFLGYSVSVLREVRLSSLDGLSWAYWHQGNCDAAAETVKQALEVWPSHRLHAVLPLAKQALLKSEEGRSQLQEAQQCLAAYPESRLLALQLDWLRALHACAIGEKSQACQILEGLVNKTDWPVLRSAAYFYLGEMTENAEQAHRFLDQARQIPGYYANQAGTNATIDK